MDIDKVIVTHMGALREKYGGAMRRIENAVKRLVAADMKRGIVTRLVAVDSPGDMEAVQGRAVENRDDPKAVKAAVDAVYHAYRPDYVMILGAPDIVPHQQLKNPAYDPRGDDDKVVPTDLPYACDATYGTDPARFIGPTRVVGRLPDLKGVADPAYLVSLLGTAARHRTRARTEYRAYFSVTAEVWKESTSLSLERLFGSSAAMATSPPKGPDWTRGQLARRVHFINCHGAPSDANFYGQKGRDYPVAHSARKLVGKIASGAVAAVECCYGAELYDPADSDMQAGICSTYLQDGAYGYFGSSTIAYGPSEGNGQADLICRYFLEEVLNGASLGEAVLCARHRFAGTYTHLDPVDLKTVIQFFLLGDPAVHPVAAVPHALEKTKVFRQVFQDRQNVRGTRRLRREKLYRTGTHLARTLGAARRTPEPVPLPMAEVLETAARGSGIRNYGMGSFSLRFTGKAKKGMMKRFDPARKGRVVYMLSGARDLPEGTPGRVLALVATSQDGELIHMRRLRSR